MRGWGDCREVWRSGGGGVEMSVTEMHERTYYGEIQPVIRRLLRKIQSPIL
jgi:hypothetical protein